MEGCRNSAINVLFILSLIIPCCMTQPHLNLSCDYSTDATAILRGQTIRIALYHGELSICNNSLRCGTFDEVTQAENNASPSWFGYDVELLEKLSAIGQFNYTIISMGSAQSISEGVGYTTLAQEVLGLTATITTPQTIRDHPADIIGQGTWRVNVDRAKWAIWTVPVVSEDVWLITKGPQKIDPNYTERALLTFRPFHWGVWLSFVITFFAMTFLLTKARMRKYGTKDEISVEMVMYHLAVSCTGRDGFDVIEAGVKGLSIGWLFFIFILAETYVANLTAILAEPAQFTDYLAGIKEVTDNHRSFCVQRGAANDIYFSNNPKWKDTLRFSLNDTYRMSSVPAQIDAVLNGTCDSAEITIEDYYTWAQTHKEHQCTTRISDSKLTRRSRAMMTIAANDCLVNAINTLYAKFTVQVNCSSSAETDSVVCDDASTLHSKWFTEVECVEVLIDSSNIQPLEIVDLVGAYAVLVVLTIIGAMGTIAGWINKKRDIPYLSWFMGSNVSQVQVNLEKLKEQRECEDAYAHVGGNNRRQHLLNVLAARVPRKSLQAYAEQQLDEERDGRTIQQEAVPRLSAALEHTTLDKVNQAIVKTKTYMDESDPLMHALLSDALKQLQDRHTYLGGISATNPIHEQPRSQVTLAVPQHQHQQQQPLDRQVTQRLSNTDEYDHDKQNQILSQAMIIKQRKAAIKSVEVASDVSRNNGSSSESDA